MIIFTRRGEQGIPGATGPTGPQGEPGTGGSALTYSEGVPDDAEGSDGDSCVDNTKMHLYHKIAGAWVFQGALATTVTNIAAKFICPDDAERTATLAN
jgi:hypothetical protein